MAKARLRGHDIVRVGGQWWYVDTGELVESAWKDRPCGHCGEKSTPDGHDECIRNLPNVRNACCGHGDPGDVYVQFDSGQHIQGQKAIEFLTQVVR